MAIAHRQIPAFARSAPKTTGIGSPALAQNGAEIATQVAYLKLLTFNMPPRRYVGRQRG